SAPASALVSTLAGVPAGGASARQLVRNAASAASWSSSRQPAMPDHGTGIYWLSGMASGARRSLAAVAAGVVSASAASQAAAHRRAAGRSLHAFRPHQLPVRIARGGIPGECPDIGDISDLVG